MSLCRRIYYTLFLMINLSCSDQISSFDCLI
uniref:Uncharacterized protein n=1 Tax=Anguilla anguilla TaxID=7936 RepID=A0A0E9QY67_ANGAN